MNEKPITKLEAKKLSNYLDEYEVVLLFGINYCTINSTSYSLQVQTNLLQGVNLLNSLFNL